MSPNRPWHTALSSLVLTLSDDEKLVAQTKELISGHESITMEEAIGDYLPLAIESADARPIHQWLESLPGVRYVDVVFCSTEESTSPHPS